LLKVSFLDGEDAMNATATTVEEKEMKDHSTSKHVIEEEEKCPECGSTHLVRDYNKGELVCDSCGLVISEVQIDQGPEWTSHGTEAGQDRIRTGAPLSYLYHDRGLSTQISIGNRDSKGNAISSKEVEKFRRMRELQHQVSLSGRGERSFAQAVIHLDRLISAMGLPKQFKEESALIYRKAAAKGLVRGRSMESVVAAVVYCVCKMSHVPRSLSEVAFAANVDKRLISKAYKAIASALKLRIVPSKPEDYLSRFCNQLGLGEEERALALRILRENATGKPYSGSPTGTAAAAIYMASILGGNKVSQRKIAQVSGISEVTLRSRFKTMTNWAGKERGKSSQYAYSILDQKNSTGRNLFN